MSTIINLKGMEAEKAKQTIKRTASLFALHEIMMELGYALGTLDPKGGRPNEAELAMPVKLIGNGNTFMLSVLCRTYGQKLLNVGRQLQKLTEAMDVGECRELAGRINEKLEEYGSTHETIVSKYLAVAFEEQLQNESGGEGDHE